MKDLYKSLECNNDDVVEIGENTYKIDRFKKAIIQSSKNSLEEELDNYGVEIPCMKFTKKV
ncbi:KGK domain-containing protein [Nostoc cycadae]|nr:KGK domain-containing protein [Nostoc cycadae]